MHGVNVNPTRTGLLDVLERMGANIAIFNRRQDRRRACAATSTCGRPSSSRRRSRRARCRCWSTSCRSSRCSRVHARGDSVVSGAPELRAKETDRIEAVVDGLRALGAHIRRDRGRLRRARRAIAATRRRGSTLTATTGSRCSARSPASSRAEGVEIARRRGGRGKLPRLLRPPRLAASAHFLMIVAIDGPAGRWQEHGRSAARRAARLPLPRHRRDVPRAHLARAPPRRSTLDSASDLAELAVENPVDVRRGRPSLHRRQRRDRLDPQTRHRQARPGRRAAPRRCGGDARAPARARPRSATS